MDRALLIETAQLQLKRHQALPRGEKADELIAIQQEPQKN